MDQESEIRAPDEMSAQVLFEAIYLLNKNDNNFSIQKVIEDCLHHNVGQPEAGVRALLP